MRTLAALFTVFVLAHAAPTSAQQVRLEFSNGTVTLHAENAPIRTILAEWSKRGGTRIVNGDRVGGGPVTLELNGVPELQAIEVLLRGVAGYMVGRREVAVTGAGISTPSAFDRIHILPTSNPPRGTTAGVGAPPRAPIPPRPPIPPPDTIDDDLLSNELPNEPDPNANRRVAPVGPVRSPARPTGVGQPNAAQDAEIEDEDDDEPPPAPTPGRGNPFGAVIGTPRPGMIVQPDPPRPSQPRPQPNADR
jgi:hypothetical protein